ncbi:V0D/AC39 family V-type ATPase subunit [Thiocystis violacea]|uniref:V0D/AC39 family V-type ATPase subunit n=1 Tax=Thiocystis violacea TaxID=13725 RepID=UPI001905D36F|nr:V-type ATPase subunit [Thiocystis violacea]MBK1723587.1 ATPase [Thiocystis violacea]
MRHVADQAYLNTLVSAMSTRLFDATLIAGLSQRSLSSLSDAFGLAALLDEQPSNAARSRAIEQSIVNVLLTELRILIRPMNAEEQGLVLDWGRKYGLYNLKTLIRGKLYDLDPNEIRANLFDLPSDIHDSDQALLRAENVLELLRQLEAGPHRQIARQAREAYEQQRDPFALEAAVDQRYYVGLVRRIMAFSDHQLVSLRRLLGAELDRVTLLWLLRFRFSYQLSPSETYYWLVPSMRLLTRERLLRLVNLETFEQVLQALPPPLDALLAESKSIADVQQRIGRYTLTEMRWVLARSQSGVARALAYLMLRETDLMLLFAAVQGRLLGFPDETIQVALDLIEPTCAHPPRRLSASATAMRAT